MSSSLKRLTCTRKIGGTDGELVLRKIAVESKDNLTPAVIDLVSHPLFDQNVKALVRYSAVDLVNFAQLINLG
jgi:hypothetical protein